MINQQEQILREVDILEDKYRAVQEEADTLRRKADQKEEQMVYRTEKDLTELQVIKERIKEMEFKLRESENKGWDLQKELEVLRNKNRQQEMDINTLNAELREAIGREETAKKKLIESEETYREFKSITDSFKKENDQLRLEIEAIENNKKSMEDKFRSRIDDIELVN